MIRNIPNNTACFRYVNANPKDRRTTDCVIRAISVATGKTWDEVLDGLVEIAHKYKIMIDDTPCYDRYLTNLGFSKMKQPRKDDNTKYTGEEFCLDYLKKFRLGEYEIVAHIGGHHIVAIIKTYDYDDSIIDRYRVIDTWDSTDGTIGNYWIRKKE